MRLKQIIKSSTKPILRPLWVRIWYRLALRIPPLVREETAPIAERIAAAEAHLRTLGSKLDSTMESERSFYSSLSATARVLAEHRRKSAESNKHHSDALTGIADKYNQLDEKWNRLSTQLAHDQRNLEERIEFVRREILFEMKYTQQKSLPRQFDLNATDAQNSPIETEILTRSKISSTEKGSYRLNLGCGLHPIDGYINIDMRKLPGVDIVATVDALPIGPGEADTIFSSHLLEHFPQESLKRKLLPYWHSLLRPGGQFHAIVPDCETMIEQAAAGNYTFDEFREVLFGAQDYAGDFHYNALTPNSLSELLNGAGFVNINVIERGRRNGLCFEFEISAQKAN